MHEESSFGAELKARRHQLGLSIKRLASISGVSRRWIVCAEKSANITMDVLKKLMQALNMTSISICPGLTADAGPGAPNTGSLAAAVEEIRRSTEFAQQAADRVRAFTLGAGKTAHVHTAEDEGFNERAAALVTHFTEHVRSLHDPQKLQKVEKAVSNFLRPEEDAPRTANSLQRKARKSSA